MIYRRWTSGQKSTCKFFWVGKPNGTGGEGILLKEKWVEHLVNVNQVNDRIVVIKVVIGSLKVYIHLTAG